MIRDDDQRVNLDGSRVELGLEIEETTVRPDSTETALYRTDAPDSTVELIFRQAFARLGPAR